MPGIAWVVLIKTATPFFRSLYFVIFECEDESTTRDESCAATINILHRSRTDREIMAPRCALAEPDLVPPASLHEHEEVVGDTEIHD